MQGIKQLIWDQGNVEHIARHGVTPEEVEEACNSDLLVLESYRGRFLIVGLTEAGQMIAFVLDPEPEEGVYYVVTARSADSKERRMYRTEKGGEKIYD